MLDLYNKQYSREDLKKNIYAVNLVDIIKTQKLNSSFIVRYILNKKYQFTEEEKKITIDMIVQFQPHITKKIIQIGTCLYNSDDDSVEDFEEVSTK